MGFLNNLQIFIDDNQQVRKKENNLSKFFLKIEGNIIPQNTVFPLYFQSTVDNHRHLT